MTFLWLWVRIFASIIIIIRLLLILVIVMLTDWFMNCGQIIRAYEWTQTDHKPNPKVSTYRPSCVVEHRCDIIINGTCHFAHEEEHTEYKGEHAGVKPETQDCVLENTHGVTDTENKATEE